MDSPEEKTPPAGKPSRRRLWLRVLSCALLVGTVVFIISFMRACEQWRRMGCGSNMFHLGLACHEYASNHDGYFPGRWSDMKNEEYYSVLLLNMRCPSTGHELGSLATVDFWADYRLLPGLTEKSPATEALIIEPLSNHQDRGAHVCFVDGHVEWWPAEKVRGH